jgi:hypothetical protein
MSALIALALCCAGALAPAAASAAPDLVVSIAGTPDPTVPGDALSVKVTAKNNGDTAANGTYIGLVMLDDATLTDGPECVNFYGHLAVCSVGTVAPGATVQRTFIFNDLKTGTLRFEGNASSDQSDARPSDNVAKATVEVEPRADLRLGLEVAGAATAASAGATLVASVRNGAPGSARETRLQLDVATGLSIVRLPDGCALSARRVTCDMGTVEPRGTATRSIPVKATQRRTYSVVGGVTWARRDANPADNQAQALLTTLSRTSVVSLARLVRGVPTSAGCVHRRSLNLRVRGPKRVRRLYLYVAGRRVRKVGGRQLRRVIRLRNLPRRGYTIGAKTSMRDGHKLVGQRRVIACGARAR